MNQDRVAVIGLGYVGLPLAISFVEAGLQVDGIDAYAGRVTELNAGSSRSTTSPTTVWPPRCDPVCACSPRCGRPDGGRRDLRVRPDPDHRPRIPTSPPSWPPPRPSAPAFARVSSSCSSRRRSRARRPARSGRSSSGAASRPARTSTSRSRRSGSTPATRPVPARACRGWSAPRRHRPPNAQPPCWRTSTTTSSRCPRPMPPSSPSCSRTCSAT